MMVTDKERNLVILELILQQFSDTLDKSSGLIDLSFLLLLLICCYGG